MNKGLILISTMLATFFTSTVSRADDASRFDIDFTANAAVGYDSNVGLKDLDEYTGEADSVRQLGMAASGRFRASDRLKLRVGYDYADTAYQQFSEFDLGLHHVVAEAAYRLPFAEAGLSLQHYAGILDGEPYLDVTHVSPSLSRLVRNKVFLRGAFISAQKDYDQQEGRDATSSGFRMDAYYLQQGMQRYVALTLQSTDETAQSQEHDFSGLQAAVTLGRRIETGLMTMDLKFRLRHERRDYSRSGDILEVRREDSRTGLSIDATVPMSDHVSLSAALLANDNRSTYEPAVSREFIATIGLKASF